MYEARNEGALRPFLDTPAAPGDMWISAAVLCATGRRPRGDPGGWCLARGGPIHPVLPYIYTTTIPLRLPMAIHLRVQGAGECQLLVSVTDVAGECLTWGTRTNEPAAFPAFLPERPEVFFELACTLRMPNVVFPSYGQFTVFARLGPGPSRGQEFGEVRLPIMVRRPPEAERPSDFPILRDFLEQQASVISAEAEQVLMSAAAEARRLGRNVIEIEHVLIGVRRTLGKPSGLPSVNMLRNAAETKGLLMWRDPREPAHLSPPVATGLLRPTGDFADTPLDGRQVLQGLSAVEPRLVERFLAMASFAPNFEPV